MLLYRNQVANGLVDKDFSIFLDNVRRCVLRREDVRYIYIFISFVPAFFTIIN